MRWLSDEARRWLDSRPTPAMYYAVIALALVCGFVVGAVLL